MNREKVRADLRAIGLRDGVILERRGARCELVGWAVKAIGECNAWDDLVAIWDELAVAGTLTDGGLYDRLAGELLGDGIPMDCGPEVASGCENAYTLNLDRIRVFRPWRRPWPTEMEGRLPR